MIIENLCSSSGSKWRSSSWFRPPKLAARYSFVKATVVEIGICMIPNLTNVNRTIWVCSLAIQVTQLNFVTAMWIACPGKVISRQSDMLSHIHFTFHSEPILTESPYIRVGWIGLYITLTGIKCPECPWLCHAC
jgi:hypothetical protein